MKLRNTLCCMLPGGELGILAVGASLYKDRGFAVLPGTDYPWTICACSAKSANEALTDSC